MNTLLKRSQEPSDAREVWETRPSPFSPHGPWPTGLDWPTRCAAEGRRLWPALQRRFGAELSRYALSFTADASGRPVPKLRRLTEAEIAARSTGSRRGGMSLAAATRRQRAVERKILGLDEPFTVRKLMIKSLIERWP